MSLTQNLWRFALSLKLMLVAFIACVLAFGYYASARDTIRTANDARNTSLLLTRELRQSSDDLTQMGRTYVVTGDRRYRDQYDEIIAIRDGLAPRPQEYDGIYWDLVLDERRPTPMGTAAALLQRMEEAGFTAEELNRLASAKQNSDLLVTIERQAMAVVENPDATQEQRLQAIRSLHDARYHRAKADIMRPIDDVSRMVAARTAATVASAERAVLGGLVLFALAGAVLVLMLWWTHRNLKLVFGGSVAQLRAAVATSTAADASAASIAAGVDRDSIIGKLVEAQQVRSSEEGRGHAGQVIPEAERRLRSLVGALDEGVCVVQDALIRFVNQKFQQILERPEEDLMDRPYIQFVHEDDRNRLIERYRKRMNNIPVDPVVEFRLITEPGVSRRVSSRGTEFEWAGRPATLYFVTPANDPGQPA